MNQTISRAVVFLCLGPLALLTGVAPTLAQAEQQMRLLPQPRRLVDTQPGSGYQGAGQALAGFDEPRCYQVAGEVGLPDDAVGVVANLTAVGHSVNGWITLFPAGAAKPDTSNVNFDADLYAVANLAMVPLGGSGRLCAMGQAGTHLILDVVGYFQQPGVGLSCPASSTLASLVDCIVDRSGMRDRSGVYVVPTDAERADFGRAAHAMLRGGCAEVVLGPTLARAYRLTNFRDIESGQRYCVLMEVGDLDGNGKVDKGWGTFIVDPAASRELNIAVAHPLDDARTQDQGIAVFAQTKSRSFLLAGARRNLGGERPCLDEPAVSTCPASDVAHNVDTMFHVVTEQLAAFYGATEWTQLQFHGNRSCPATDIHMSYGVAGPLIGTDKLSRLKGQLRQRNASWTVTLFGEPGQPCDLNGTTNVQGQVLNNRASATQRSFIHIEQYMDEQRNDRRDPENWIPAILATWP